MQPGHVTFLRKLSSDKGVQQVLQVVHGSYGTNANFRGHIIKSVLGHLQSICCRPTGPSESGDRDQSFWEARQHSLSASVSKHAQAAFT
jgi:hypothetical protein